MASGLNLSSMSIKIQHSLCINRYRYILVAKYISLSTECHNCLKVKMSREIWRLASLWADKPYFLHGVYRRQICSKGMTARLRMQYINRINKIQNLKKELKTYYASYAFENSESLFCIFLTKFLLDWLTIYSDYRQIFVNHS